MDKSSKKYEPIMREVLSKFRAGEEYKTLYAKYGEADVHEALGRCVENGDIPNATARRTESGVYQIDFVKK